MERSSEARSGKLRALGRRHWLGAGLLLLFAWFQVPVPSFDEPHSRVLYDRGGKPLAGSVALDGQWRFPPSDNLSERYLDALLFFEDRSFYKHPGIDPLSIVRAIVQNIKAGRVVSGASTLTMQTVRLSRRNPPRTFVEKFYEAVLSTRLEWRLSKGEILKLYAAHAPFGGNTVGLDAASWRYFQRPPKALSWSEAALLAVLPNSPGLLHPGRGRLLLKKKRDTLLKALHDADYFNTDDLELARAEPLPQEPKALPQRATHLLGYVTHSTVDSALQRGVESRASSHLEALAGQGITNVSAMVVAVKSGEVLAYLGNVARGNPRTSAPFVDIARSPRSSGSTLKPFLYGALVEEGSLFYDTLVVDVPVHIGGYIPANFNRGYDGAVPAREALARSLNIPAVLMLREYGVDRFFHQLKAHRFSHLDENAKRYGLALVLGGAEVSLHDLAGAYAQMANRAGGGTIAWSDISFDTAEQHRDNRDYPLSQGAAFLTLEALLDVRRPGVLRAWRRFASSKKVAWKTGTSFGFRDAWAVGVTPEYAVAVWVGNANGEARPNLVGTRVAAPLLFSIFDLLPVGPWFERPENLGGFELCAHSGKLAGPHCAESKTGYLPRGVVPKEACGDCRTIQCVEGCDARADASCARLDEMESKKWFSLPSGVEHYYRQAHSVYRALPPLRTSCSTDEDENALFLIHPKPGAALLIPRELNGERGALVFEAAHRRAKARLFWHLDGEFLVATDVLHQITVSPAVGSHTLVVVDDEGMQDKRVFRVLASE